MRSHLPFVLTMALISGCATAPVRAPAAVAAPPVRPIEQPAAAPSDLAEQLARAGRSDAPTLASVERRLGSAEMSRREGAGAMLTYQAETCALALIFTADARNEMRLSRAEALPRREGEPAPAFDACVAAAEAQRR